MISNPDFIRKRRDSHEFFQQQWLVCNEIEWWSSIDLKAEQPSDTTSGKKLELAAPEVKEPGKGELHPLAAEIQEEWSKLADADLHGVKNQEDLTAKVAIRYGIPSDAGEDAGPGVGAGPRILGRRLRSISAHRDEKAQTIVDFV